VRVRIICSDGVRIVAREYHPDADEEAIRYLCRQAEKAGETAILDVLREEPPDLRGSPKPPRPQPDRR